jgi:hypothetical protein
VNALKSLISTIFVGTFGVLIALGLLELGVRLLVPVRTAQGPGWNDRPLFYFRSPSVPSMQDYPHIVPKPDDVFRIGVIGDSFTFAPYMQFTDTFPKKLEQMLNLNDTTRRVEVINYGVPAYSTSHEVGVAKTAVQEGSDAILLQITLNDPEVKHHTPTGITENMQDRFGALNLEGRSAWLARHWRSYGFVATRLHNTKTHAAYIDYFNDLFENPRSWKPFADSMGRLVETVRSQNKTIIAVVFPLFGIPMDDTYPFYDIHAKVEELMTSLKVPVLDLSEIYKGIPLDRLQVIPGVDRHPNEIAHRMAAERIYLWLEKQKIVPQEFLIQEKFATRLGTRGQRPWSGHSTNTADAISPEAVE